jgi:hypothetical protein
MPVQQLEVPEADLKQARQSERGRAALERAGSLQENMVRAIAEGIAWGRQQGLELAKKA